MLGWGYLLFIIGALSFVLPLFGRQFVLVKALGFTGASSVLIGLIFMGAGAFLFYLGKQQEKREDALLKKLQEMRNSGKGSGNDERT